MRDREKNWDPGCGHGYGILRMKLSSEFADSPGGAEMIGNREVDSV